jgi:hypothetical protein
MGHPHRESFQCGADEMKLDRYRLLATLENDPEQGHHP